MKVCSWGAFPRLCDGTLLPIQIINPACWRTFCTLWAWRASLTHSTFSPSYWSVAILRGPNHMWQFLNHEKLYKVSVSVSWDWKRKWSHVPNWYSQWVSIDSFWCIETLQNIFKGVNDVTTSDRAVIYQMLCCSNRNTDLSFKGSKERKKKHDQTDDIHSPNLTNFILKFHTIQENK